MPPRRLLGGSAFLFGAAGLWLLFLPREAAGVLGLEASADLPMQLAAAGVLAVAVLNWAGRGAVYGGIYGRPLILANLVFGMVAAGSLASASLDGHIGPAGWVCTGVMVVHVLFFGVLLRQPPWREGGNGAGG